TTRTVRIVGVTPPGMQFPHGADAYLPRELFDKFPSYTAHNWQVLARRKPDATVAAAGEDVRTILQGIHRDVGNLTITVDGQVIPLREQIVGKVSALLY